VIHLAGLPNPVRMEVFRGLWAEQCGFSRPELADGWST
ncbi:hypothetical protein AK812_SmicGene46062, partial [Symbiodinium microadriaticum]